MRTIRVLLVDDNPEFLDAAARFVATVPNVKVVGLAVSAQEALEQIISLSPELVMMDYVMPDVNGVEATQRIKALPEPPRVVILTLHDIPEYNAQAEAAGADGFLAKVDLVTNFLPLVNHLFAPPDECSGHQPQGKNPILSWDEGKFTPHPDSQR